MYLDKFLGSKTKTDILKYLFFKRQGVSIRALETELERTFPAIKKQVDGLLHSNILRIDKENNKWSIYITEDANDIINQLLYFSLEFELKKIFSNYESVIENYFLGRIFGKNIDADVVIVYRSIGAEHLDKIKEEINSVFRSYFVEKFGLASLSSEDFHRRYRLADKFVLNLVSNK